MDKLTTIAIRGLDPAEEEKKRKCYRCGSEEHIAKDCKAEAKCYVCGADGHRADSARCSQGQRQQKTSAAEPSRLNAEPKNPIKKRRRKAKEVTDFEEEEEAEHAPGAEQGKEPSQEELAAAATQAEPAEAAEQGKDMIVNDNGGQQPEKTDDQNTPVQS